MKNFILLSGIILATLTSCSTDDDLTFEQNSKNKILIIDETTEPYNTNRDTLSKVIDSIASEPIKPIKD